MYVTDDVHDSDFAEEIQIRKPFIDDQVSENTNSIFGYVIDYF